MPANKKKIMVVAGTRPNFTKLAPLLQELDKKKGLKSILVHTGQHYDYLMSEVFFKELGIKKPDYYLGIKSGSHSEQTAKAMLGVEKAIKKEKPDLMLVIGDVNSTLAGALAAAKCGIKVVHVESGLRSFDKLQPEEINRVIVDHISDCLLCPTKTAIERLKREGITKNVYLTGDIMLDIFLKMEKQAKKPEGFNFQPKSYILATIHRAKSTNTREDMENIIEAFSSVKNIVFPCHPRTEKLLKSYGLWQKAMKNAFIIPPVTYLEMVWLLKNAKKVFTDSGGIQREAFFAKIPCITLEDSSKWWPETFVDNWNKKVLPKKEDIVKAIMSNAKQKPQKKAFGDGTAAKKIADVIEKIA